MWMYQPLQPTGAPATPQDFSQVVGAGFSASTMAGGVGRRMTKAPVAALDTSRMAGVNTTRFIVQRSFAGALAQSQLAGASARRVGKPTVGVLNNTRMAGALTRRPGKILTLAEMDQDNFSTALVNLKLTLVTLTGAQTQAAAIAKRVGKPLAGSPSLGGAVAKRVSKLVAGALNNTRLAGAVLKRASKSVVGSQNFTAAVAARVAKAVAGSPALSATTVPLKVFLRAVGGTLDSTRMAGANTRLQLKGFAATGTLNSTRMAGAAVRRVLKPVAGGLTPAGSVGRLVAVRLVGSQALAGTVVRRLLFDRAFGGDLTFSGSVSIAYARRVATGGTMDFSSVLEAGILAIVTYLPLYFVGKILPAITTTVIVRRAIETDVRVE